MKKQIKVVKKPKLKIKTSKTTKKPSKKNKTAEVSKKSKQNKKKLSKKGSELVNKATRKINKEISKTKKGIKSFEKKVKKSIFNDKKVQKKIDKWANIIITESGEIIDKGAKKIKEVISKSPEAKTGKKVAKQVKKAVKDIEETSRKGKEDKFGNWNGSTMSDEQIENIQNPEEKKLCEKLDKIQEEIRRAREDKDDLYYIAQLNQEAYTIRQKLNKINHKYID